MGGELQKCKTLGFNFSDMALTGGRIGAESGTLTLLCGGEVTLIENLNPVLQAIAKKVIYFGSAGSGMRYKLILNFLQAVHVIGFGQAMKIAKACDLDLKLVSQALVARPGGAVTEIAQKAYFETPSGDFSIEWMNKDPNAKKIKKSRVVY
jgi:3-hydroxyisobutyrate dehydrogenase-like beta-hydroxyacid dehydrogenase